MFLIYYLRIKIPMMYCRTSPHIMVLQLILSGCLEKRAPSNTRTMMPKADCIFLMSPILSIATNMINTNTKAPIAAGVKYLFSETEK